MHNFDCMALDSSYYRMADRVVNGRLDAILAAYTAEKLSAGQITRRLLADHGVDVTVPTVQKWVAALPPEAVSA